MTSPPATTPASALAPERDTWRAEMAETVKLALPIALTQLGQIAMMTSDLALIGRLGDQRGRGGRARAHRAVHACSCSAWGIVSAVAPLAAQAYRGARSRAWCAARCASDCGRRSFSACRSRWCSSGAARF